jgi:hypothetical protein
MLNAAPPTLSAARMQRPGASIAATFFNTTLPALPLIGSPAQLAWPGCLAQPPPRGGGLGDGGGEALGGGVDGLGDGEALGGGVDGLGLGDGLGDATAGGEGLGTAGLGDGTGLETGVDDTARREGGSALRRD